MKMKYKDNGKITHSHCFNIENIDEILTPDGPVQVCRLDVFLEKVKGWKDLGRALNNNDVICDDRFIDILEPPTEADRQRGFTLWHIVPRTAELNELEVEKALALLLIKE